MEPNIPLPIPRQEAASGPPRPYIRGVPLLSIDLSDFTPIADILVMEKRNCVKCKFGSYLPSGIMRLWTSHTGPHRHALIPRKPTEIPLPVRGTRVVETLVESCLNCWKATFRWDELIAITPEPPAENPPFPLNGTFARTAEAKLREAVLRANAPGVSREARERIKALGTGSGATPLPPATLDDLI